MNLKNHPFYLLAFALLFVTTKNTSASVVSYANRWRKTELQVCYAKPSMFKKSELARQSPDIAESDIEEAPRGTQVLLETTIQKTFLFPELNIKFIGWKACESSTSSDIMIFFLRHDSKVEIDGRATIGTGKYTEFKGLLDFGISARARTDSGVAGLILRMPKIENRLPRLSKMSPLTSFKFTAIHEFGHILGLDHEHNREEMDFDPNCSMLTSVSRDLPQIKYSFKRHTSDYDPQSIMHYCWKLSLHELGTSFPSTDRTTNRKMAFSSSSMLWVVDDTVLKSTQNYSTVLPRLSSRDKHALRCLYKYDEATKAKICNDKFNQINWD